MIDQFFPVENLHDTVRSGAVGDINSLAVAGNFVDARTTIAGAVTARLGTDEAKIANEFWFGRITEVEDLQTAAG